MNIAEKLEPLMEWFMNNIGAPVFFIALVVIVLGLISLPVMFFLNRNEPETWTLRKDEWICTSGHTRKQEICSKGCRWETIQVCDVFERRTSENQ